MQHKIDINIIKAFSMQRKKGYMEEMLNRGQLIDGYININDKDFRDINKSFYVQKNNVEGQDFADGKKIKQEPPNVLNMAKSLAASTVKWANHGFKFATEEQITNRLNECHSCEFWNAKALRGTGRCMKCGCSTWAKIRLATEKCPIGKWQPLV